MTHQPAPEQTALRDRIAEALHHHLARTADIRMTKDGEYAFVPEITDPERMRITDAVLSVPSASVDRADAEHRLALSMALGLGTGAPWDAIHERATELGLPPLGQDPVARRLGLVAEHRATVLEEAATFVEAMNEGCGQAKPCASCDAREDAAAELRRVAAETPNTTDSAALARVERLALTFEVSGNEFIAERIRAAVAGVEPAAAEPADEAPTPCGPVPSQCDAEAGEPCPDHEREQAHAEGEHCFCGPECEGVPTGLPLLFWDESAGVIHHDGRITLPVIRAANLAQYTPAGQLILQMATARALRRALTTALNDDAAAQQPKEA